ncbi:hypothetical protein Clacol_001284 [Clathrus columnatus]|uniref:C2H2-type domain-containing protein n=1 Tax=Clathrus columnatus TaxID=1419009 RepID=A0AAV5A251_9AGAM|nr:hypothetical protein Clacol_001284 [Clathrus columnatus]
MSPRIDKCFPGPLRILPNPRCLASSPTPTSSSSSPYSSDNSPPSYRSASPLPWTGKLPPIRHLAPSPRDNLPHLSSVRWDHDDDWKSSSKYSSSCNPHDDHKHKGVAHQSCYSSSEVMMSRDYTAHYEYSQRSPNENTFQRRGSISNSSPDSAYYESQSQKSKFGMRKGTRFYCTYVSRVTGERCAAWDQGWTVYATLNRHAESDHAHEELALIANGELTYNEAQIVTSREKQERIEENLANTGRCPDCGTVFSSNRKDSLTRHKQTNACEKAQKRGRPPTKFPKKPKGPSIQVMEVESGDEGY